MAVNSSARLPKPPSFLVNIDTFNFPRTRGICLNHKPAISTKKAPVETDKSTKTAFGSSFVFTDGWANALDSLIALICSTPEALQLVAGPFVSGSCSWRWLFNCWCLGLRACSCRRARFFCVCVFRYRCRRVRGGAPFSREGWAPFHVHPRLTLSRRLSGKTCRGLS